MTATKMAVDLRRLQLHAGRSSAPTVPRAPGTGSMTASSLLVQHRPLLVICTALRGGQAGILIVLTHEIKLMFVSNFLLQHAFDTFAQRMN